MSHWLSDWRRLRERLHATDRAFRVASESVATDPKSKMLLFARVAAAELLDEVDRFLGLQGEAVPEAARHGLTKLAGDRRLLTDLSNGPSLVTASAHLTLSLASIDYHFADPEVAWRSLVERAFLHLDRVLVVDADARRRWGEALKVDEPACERLGGVHLLHHGIWGFKAHGAGERTDLVLGTPISSDDIRLAARAAETMVLTEWKRVLEPNQLEGHYAAALSQLRQYPRGVLAGFELQSMRYAITVAHDRLTPRPDLIEGPVTYRHLHIAVAPSTPSVVSKRA